MKPLPCASGVYCEGCRAGDESVVYFIGDFLGLTPPDFECPFGVPKGHKYQPPTERTIVVFRDPADVRDIIEDHCDDCESQIIGDADDAWPDGVPGCKRIQTCGGRPCFTRFHQLLRNGEPCPVGKFNNAMQEA